MRKPLISKWIAFLLLIVILPWQPVQAHDQKLVEVRGTYIVLWGDGSASAPGSVRTDVLMLSSGQQIELVFSSQSVIGINLVDLNRHSVIVNGSWLVQTEDGHQRLKVSTIQADESLALEPEGVFGHQPWVSILCKFADYSIEPENLAYFQGMYSAAYPGLDHYWREQSFDKVDLIGSNAYGWYTLPYNRSHYVPASGYMDWDAAANDCTAVAEADVYFPNFVGINLMFNADLDGYAWGGSWYLCLDGVCKIWRMTWEPPWGYGNIGVIGHETGHGFGLPHSSGDYGLTYDNAWDVMSDVWSNGDRGGVDDTYGTLGQHTIAFHKNILEWIDSDHMVVLTTGTKQTVALERIAQPVTDDALGVKVLINNSENTFYMIEARRFIGYDSWLPGDAVIIHHVDVGRDNPAHVVDIDRDGDTGDEGAMWLPGETFVDTVSGIRISVDAITATGFIVTIANKYIDLTAVEISGPVEGIPGEAYTFSAQVSPLNATQPVTYVWEATGQETVTHTNGLDDQVEFSWLDMGTKTITVTATNDGGTVSDVHSVNVQLTAPNSVAINGPLTATVGIEQTYFAAVEPITTTVPLTYVWQVNGLETVTHTGGVTDTASVIFTEPGEQTISLRAMNSAGEVTAAHHTMVVLPELNVTISGTDHGYTGMEYILTAEVSPITATIPLTYIWTIGDLPPVIHTNGISDTLMVSFDEVGMYPITLVVSNLDADGSAAWAMTIYERLYIPILRK